MQLKDILHLIVRSHSNKRAKNILKRSPLLAKSIDRFSSRTGKRSLKPITQNGQDRVESSKLLGLARTILNPRKEFGDDGQINDQGRGEQGILADGVHGNGITSTHHKFGMILVHSDFGVTDRRDVFNHDAMIDSLSLLVVEENFVGGDDVVDDGGFTDLLGTELTWRRQVLAVVIAWVSLLGEGVPR